MSIEAVGAMECGVPLKINLLCEQEHCRGVVQNLVVGAPLLMSAHNTMQVLEESFAKFTTHTMSSRDGRVMNQPSNNNQHCQLGHVIGLPQLHSLWSHTRFNTSDY